MSRSTFSRYSLLLIGFIDFLYCYMDISRRFNMGRMVDSKNSTIEHVFNNYAISTDSPTCSKIGKEILDQGGTAVDASIAALFCLSVVHPHSSGIGGGGFMLLYNFKNKSSEFVNFRETAASCGNKNMGKHNHQLISKGGLSVAVPGELKGYDYVWKKYSKLPWQKLIQPSISMLRAGVKVDDSLTNTFEIISLNGPDIFYTNFSDIIEKEIHEKYGCLSKFDLMSYTVTHENPSKMQFGKTKVLLSSAPSSGPLLGFILNIFKGFNFSLKDIKDNPVKVYHCLIETFKFSFAHRTNLSDPKFNKNIKNVSLYVRQLLSEEYANKIRARIDSNKIHNVSYYGHIKCNRLKSGTTHLVVIDKFKNVVSVTSTINGYFGAKFASRKYGFIYNNEMDDFCFPDMFNDYMLPPSLENYPKPGKRPLSSSVPTIILDDLNEPLIAIGGSGGSIITTAVAQVSLPFPLRKSTIMLTQLPKHSMMAQESPLFSLGDHTTGKLAPKISTK
ncbi:hypothetical protein HZS_4280, partial [Henneguya salminicola]